MKTLALTTLLLGALGIAHLRAQVGGVTDPVGYFTYTLPGVPAGTQQQTPISYPLVRPALWGGDVASVAGQTVTLDGAGGFASGLPNLYLSFRNGTYAGLAVPIQSVTGDVFTLGESPAGALQPGLRVIIRPYDTLDSLFSAMPGQWLRGSTAETTDNILLWDAVQQAVRVFYLTTSSQWQEAGQAGDAGGVLVPFPASFAVLRRGAQSVDLLNIGTVFTTNRRWQKVHPGLNMLGTPFGFDATLASCRLYTMGTSYSAIAGLSPVEADTVTFYNIAQRMPSVWYSSATGQALEIGSNADLSNMVLPFNGALLLDRVGPATWVNLRYSDLPDYPVGNAPAARLAPMPSKTKAKVETPVPASLVRGHGKSAVLKWSGHRSAIYKVQINTGNGWKPYRTVRGSSPRQSMQVPTIGTALFRILK